MSEDTFSLTLRQMRLGFARVGGAGGAGAGGGGGGLGYGLSVRTDDSSDWRAVSARDNPLVRGSTFNLYPAEAHRHDDRTLILRGARRVNEGLEFSYTATVEADPRQNWFRFDVQIDSPQPIPLAMSDGFEPEIMLDL